MKIKDFSGAWALVTGASSGIGLAIARDLAAGGINCLLVSRSKPELTRLANDLSQEFGIKTRVMVSDLTKSAAGEKLFLACQKAGLKIEILINNAGVGLRAGEQHTQELAEVRQLAALNIQAALELASLFAAEMAEGQRGAILNIASTASFQPMPWAALYGASKAFLLSLSEAMHLELKPFGVAVTALCPGITDTNFFKHGRPRVPGWLYPFLSPERVSRLGLKALFKNRPVVIPSFRHWLFAQVHRFLPRAWVLGLMGMIERRRKGLTTKES